MTQNARQFECWPDPARLSAQGWGRGETDMRREITINLPHDTDPLFAQALLELDPASLVDLLLGRGELVDVNVPTKPHPRGRFTAAKVERLLTCSVATAPFEEHIPSNKLSHGEAVAHRERATNVDLDELLDQAAMFGTLDDVMGVLTAADPKAAKSVSMYYGLDDDDPKLYREIGAALGVTGQACRVYKERGMKKLKKMLTQ